MKKQASMVDVVYYKLKSEFISNTIAYGEKMVIRTLAERYQTSETPIKQALNRLVSEGLVEAIPDKGMKRKEWSLEDVESTLEVRLMIETFYAAKIIKNIDYNVDTLEKMERSIAQHREAILSLTGPNDYVKMYELDRRFHNEYLKCTGNSKIIDIYDKLGTHTYENFVYGKKTQERMLLGVAEHVKIFNALEARDVAALTTAVTEHIVNAVETFRVTFKLHKVNF